MAHWNQYFTEKNVNHIFFSALEEQFKIDLETTEEVAEIEPIDEEDIVATGLLAEIEREEAMEAEKERK
jgi:NAD-dependent DNA ligase